MTTERALTEHEQWIVSFYRVSEISGALFFGRLAKTLRPGPIQMDLTKHFADESQHAWYWTDCLKAMGLEPLRLSAAYQDQYITAGGMPANLMEVLAITQVFEKRVINQYALHMTVPGLHPVIKGTLEKIVQDERWHIQWVDQALKGLAPEYGEQYIRDTLARFKAADEEVYQKTVGEHAERVTELLKHRAELSGRAHGV